MDRGFIALLLLTSLTGLALLVWRDSAAMALLLALHLGVVMALFLTLPYGKFAHGVYRARGAAQVGDRKTPAEPASSSARSDRRSRHRTQALGRGSRPGRHKCWPARWRRLQPAHNPGAPALMHRASGETRRFAQEDLQHETSHCNQRPSAPWRSPGTQRRRGAAAHRHQVQPRRDQRHAQGQGRAEVQGTRREVHQAAGSRSRSIRTRRCTRTRRRWTRCSWARCRCWRPSTAKFRPIGVPEFEALDLPYRLRRRCRLRQGRQRARRQVGLLKKLEAKGIIGLAFWDNGFHMVSANLPLLMPADFQGLKIRISGSKIADLYFRAARRAAADPGLLRGLPGAADRRRRRLREHAVELLHAEVLRGAEAHHGVQPRPPAVRGDHQHQVLDGPAAGHPRPARQGDERGHRIQQLDRQAGEHRCAGEDQGLGQDARCTT